MTRKMTLGFGLIAFFISGMLACGSGDADPAQNTGSDTVNSTDTTSGTDEGNTDEDVNLSLPDEGNTQTDPGTVGPDPEEAKAQCQDYALCAFGCGQNQSCFAQCTQSFPLGEPLFSAINNCILAQCGQPPGGNQQDPIWAACLSDVAAEGGACFQSRVDCGLIGTGSCSGVVTCSQGCTNPQTQNDCINKCLWGSDANGQDLYMAFNNCVASSCNAECVAAGASQAACQTCQQEKCINEIQACQADM